ncbi:shikimate dehydrogenase [Dermatobacter hominis]|uniref:shikimate dehydrogenase n=1 Tax=Dermatobacter hominis TaxID=2884263 RepID=UPI001D10BE18|nr:shikimate dehydrogenase [Dermatobacter hominis]UDY36181.1 shikimate dehydrogenase [Dermatobacter hominis]
MAPGAGPSGSTLVAGVIGDPVAHSLSPRIHNAAFRALGLDWVFVALPVARGQAAAAVDGARALGLRGLSVTMPHKEAVIASLDGLTSAAAELGAVNCILRAPHDDALLLGDNTDGQGYLRGLKADLGVEPAGRRFVVVGAGGAGRAVVQALAAAGAAAVTVVNRDPGRGEVAAALAGAVGALVPAADAGAVAAAVGAADVLVNATPVGMGDDGDLPVPEGFLRPDLVVSELVYHPATTPLVAAARRRGAPTANGLSMLVHQAAVAFEHWTGAAAPVEAMAAAAAAG